MDTPQLLKHRMLKFRKIGGFQEGLPVDPEKKVNMKQKEEPKPGLISNQALQSEVNRLKEQIMKAKESSSMAPDMDQNGLINKLKREIEYEFSEAAKALGVQDKINQMRDNFDTEKELTSDQIEDLENLKKEFNEKLSTAPNYGKLKYKLNLLNEIKEAKAFAENYKKTLPLKTKVNETFKQVLENPILKNKIEGLKAEIEKLGGEGLDEDLKEKMMEVKAEVETEFLNALEASGVHVASRMGQASMEMVKAKVNELNAEINQIIQDVVENTPELKSKLELLKFEVIKDKKNPSKESKEKIKDLEIQLKEEVAYVMTAAAVKEKYERLQAELKELSGGSDGSLIKEPSYV